jgi:hypothetical protein
MEDTMQTIATLPWRTRTRTLELSGVLGRLEAVLHPLSEVRCGWCGKVKGYIRASGTSHGICADCARIHFPEVQL